MEMDKSKNILGAIFFALSLAVLAYMLVTPLNQIIIHCDEYFTFSVSHLPITDIITVTANDVHPPLHYLMCKAVLKLAAMFHVNELFSLKLLSIVPYVLILVISATKIRKENGLFTAGLFGFSMVIMSDFFKYYLTVRMYSWAILFVLLTFIYAKEIITHPSKKSWVLLTAFAVLSAYTHYFAAITAGVIYLGLLIYIIARKRECLEYWAVSTLDAIVLYVPWLFALVTQLINVHNNYWIQQVNSNTVLMALGYFAYNTNILFGVIALLILLIIVVLYIKYSENLSKKEQFTDLSGIGVYFGTIILVIVISYVFKPILVIRYLLPATAVLWLTISIILGKIEDKKMFIISMVLISLLLISGIVTITTSIDPLYQTGMNQKEIIENITENNNTMVMVMGNDAIMYFINFAKDSDMYCQDTNWVFGEDGERLHKIYNYTDYNRSNPDKAILNNSNKDIYIISWKDPKVNATTITLDKGDNFVFSKVNTTSLKSSKIHSNKLKNV